jgi:uncharacterized membrane protein
MNRSQAAAVLAAMAALSTVALVAPWQAAILVATGSWAGLRRGRAGFAVFTAATLAINAVLMAAFLQGGTVWRAGPLELWSTGASIGLRSGLRMVAVVGANLAILSRIPVEALLDGLRLPARSTAWLAAVLIAAHDVGRDHARLRTAARLQGRNPRGLRQGLSHAAALLPTLLLLACERGRARRDALRVAGHDVNANFAPLVAVTALAVAGRLALLPLPNIKLTYVVVFLGGLLFGTRIGVLAGLASMALTDLLLTGLAPMAFANVPAMALLGALGGLLRRVDFTGSNRTDRVAGRALAASAGLVATLVFSASSDALTWLMVPELRAEPDALRALLLTGLAFNVLPAIVNAALFAASVPASQRIFRELQGQGQPGPQSFGAAALQGGI